MATYPEAAVMQEQVAFAVDPSAPYPPMMTGHHPVPLPQPNYTSSEHIPPGVVPTPNNSSSQNPHNSQNPQSGPVKPRLRKACDACSLRKVKCDESQPCRPCAGLGIECKFERPSRRRGPPNKHAENLKRQRLDSDGHSGPSSPTHAARTLASFAQQQVLSIETIAQPPIVYQLIDEYFTYVHPTVPIPHEPTFRDLLDRREDLKDSSFLALIASMVGCVLAAQPRRSWHFFRSQNPALLPHTPGLLIERCHSIVLQARDANYLDREFSPNEPVISYLVSMTGLFTCMWFKARIYLDQALTMARILSWTKCNGPHYTTPDGTALTAQTENGHDLQQSVGHTDYVLQETARRTFWLIFVAVKRLQQLGMPSEESILPSGNKYPPLPLEVDDRCVVHDRVLPQPQGTISEVSGFNAIVRLYLSYNKLSILDVADCIIEGSKEDIQERLVQHSLRLLAKTMAMLPNNLVPAPAPLAEDPASQLSYPPPMPDALETQQANLPNGQFQEAYPIRRQRATFDVQKAEIAATELSSRMQVVRSYFLSTVSQGSQDDGHARNVEPSKDKHESMEQSMLNEQEEITKRLVGLLSTLNQFTVESIAGDFLYKLEVLSSNLLSFPRTRKSPFAQEADGLLQAFLDLLAVLGYLEPQRGVYLEIDEEAQMRCWAEFTESYQSKFAKVGGVEGEV